MNVFTGNQAKTLFESDKIPVNSIGVFKDINEWHYWYWDGHKFDTGTKPNETLALRAAKANFI